MTKGMPRTAIRYFSTKPSQNDLKKLIKRAEKMFGDDQYQYETGPPKVKHMPLDDLLKMLNK